VVRVTPRKRFTPGERTPGTHWIGGWVGPRAGLDAEARRGILCPCRGSNPDRPSRNQTLYCLSYRGSLSWLNESRIPPIAKSCSELTWYISYGCETRPTSVCKHSSWTFVIFICYLVALGHCSLEGYDTLGKDLEWRGKECSQNRISVIKPFGRTWRWCECIKTDLRKICSEDGRRIELIDNSIQWWASGMNMEAVCFSATLVSTDKSTRRYNPEDQHRHLHRRENLKSPIFTGL
jgi:hypothetical protein